MAGSGTMDGASLDRSLEDLPPLPTVLVQALRIFNEPEFEFDQLDEVIRKDQSLVSHVLKIANSPFYGLTGKISSLKEAFIILGSNTLRNLVLGVSIMRQLGGAETPVLDQRGLWMHAFGTATFSRRVALEVAHVDEEAAFVAGLLHDIGKAFMNICFIDDLRRVTDYMQEHDCLYTEAEGHVLTMDHAFVGERLAQRWHLSEEIVRAIGGHHRVGVEAKVEPLADIVHVADSLCRAVGFGDPGDDGVTAIDSGTMNRLGLDLDSIEQVMMETYPKLISARDFMD